MGLKELVDNSKAIIFDLDGTLIDSMNVWSDIDKEFFKMYDLPFEEDYQKDIGHKGLKEIAAYTKTRYNLKESEDEIVTIWLDILCLFRQDKFYFIFYTGYFSNRNF